MVFSSYVASVNSELLMTLNMTLAPDHETVAAGGLDFEELQGTSVEALHQDDSAERDAIEIPQKLSQADEHLRNIRLTNQSLERMVTATRELAARAGRLASDRMELDVVSNELAAVKTQGVELAAQAEAKKDAIAALKNALGNQESSINGLRGLVSQADQLRRAEAALAELMPHEQVAVNELATLEARTLRNAMQPCCGWGFASCSRHRYAYCDSQVHAATRELDFEGRSSRETSVPHSSCRSPWMSRTLMPRA